MIEFLQTVNQYHWLTFALIIVMLEIFGFAGFMLGFSLAGFLVFIVMSITAITWQVQIAIFAVSSIIFSIAWYLYQFKKDSKDEAQTMLNKKESYLVGQRITLEEDLEVGKGRVKFSDTTWPVYTDKKLLKGDVVEVTKVNGIFLHIEKIK